MIQGAIQYYCHGFSLNCYKPAYLVEVNKEQTQHTSESLISDLPEWVFSRNAIWVTAGESPMFLRATCGDEIKQMFGAMKE
jgi:hypothetical protein